MGVTDLMSEGLLIPPLHLYRAGRRNDDFVTLLLANVRLSGQVWGDLEAQMAANETCRRRAVEFLTDTGQDDFEALSAAIHGIADQAMRHAVSAIPDGVYRSEVAADGVGGQPTRIACAITVSGEAMTVDYTGSSPQVQYATNSTLNYTTAQAGRRDDPSPSSPWAWTHAIDHATAGDQPPLARALMTTATRAAATASWRVAIIDAATATEVALTTGLTNRLSAPLSAPVAEAIVDRTRMLGPRIELAKAIHRRQRLQCKAAGQRTCRSMELKIIQVNVGHETDSSTAIYTHVSDDFMNTALRRALAPALDARPGREGSS